MRSANPRDGLREDEVRIGAVRSPILQGGPEAAEEAVVFVHGSPGSSRDWEDLLAKTCVPGPHKRETALGVGLDLGAGRHAAGHAAGPTDLRDHLVDDPRVQRLAPLGAARVQVDRAGPRGYAGGVTRQLFDRHRYRGVFVPRPVAVERRL
jgi:pimeloyl-ACP methyl ester carboxylesterase